MGNILLLLGIVGALFAALGAVISVVSGFLLPLLADHIAWMGDPWFQAAVKMVVLIFVVVMPLASLLTWMERKESAMMQDRLGPNRAAILGVRAYGIIHFMADAVKMIMKEDFVPKKANRALFTLAPFMAVVPVLVIFCIIPFGPDLCVDEGSLTGVGAMACEGKTYTMQVARLDVGMLFYFAIASLAVYGTTLAGWSSYNKWSLLGGLRASSQMMSYEVTMGMAVLGAFLVYGTLEPHAIVEAQGSNPLHWGIVTQPLGAILFFTAAMAETKRTPFDTPEGESEVIGYFVEYSGMRFGTFFLAEFVEIVFLSAIMATVFFGGWQVPLLYSDGFHFGSHVAELPHIAVLMIQTTVWGLKVIIFCWLQLLIRWTLPRMRPDQLIKLGWTKLLPLSLFNIMITALVILWNKG